MLEIKPYKHLQIVHYDKARFFLVLAILLFDFHFIFASDFGRLSHNRASYNPGSRPSPEVYQPIMAIASPQLSKALVQGLNMPAKVTPPTYQGQIRH